MNTQARIRALFAQDPAPKTAKALAIDLNIRTESVTRSLKSMPEAYIFDWKQTSTGGYKPRWCLVQVPEDAPKPTNPARP